MSDQFQTYRLRVDNCLRDAVLPSSPIATHLHDAMAYSVLNGGKRIRATLAYLIAEMLGAELSKADSAACAVELVHAYSLVHDDLPAMDNDDLRRGKPSCHKAYDEATAILVGDALQALAFELLARDKQLNAEQRILMLKCLAQHAGATGMVGGQSLDIAAEGQSISEDQLETIHAYKTGALIKASALLGAYSANCTDETRLTAIEQFAEKIGLAFQIQDDIIDVESTTEQLGKQQGSDAALDKSTYVSLLGMEQAKQKLNTTYTTALNHLAPFGEAAKSVAALASFLVQRQY